MKTAWLCSIAAQAVLVTTLLRSGRRDAWTAFLALDIMRSAALWPLTGTAYWWTWLITQPVLSFCQILAVVRVVQPIRLREVLHIGLVMGSSIWLWSVLLTDDHWPIARRVPLMIMQGYTLGCCGVLAAPLVYGHVTDKWMLSYFAAQSFSLIVGQITVLDPIWKSVHLLGVGMLFLAWAKSEIRGTFWAN